MSEVLRDLVVSLSLDGDNFSRNLASINKQIQEAESEFRQAAAGVDGFEKSTKGMESRLSSLQQKYALQQKAVTQYEKALGAAEKKLENAYTKQTKLTEALDQAKEKNADLKQKVADATKQYENFRRTLGDSDSATIAAKENLDALSQEYAESGEEVKKLEGQLAANTKNLQNNADAVTKAKTNLNNARAALRQTDSEIKATTEQLARMQSAWTKAGDTLTAFGAKCASVSTAMTKTGKALTASVTTPILALGTAAVKASVEYESAFASVRKTVDATEAEYEELSDSVKQMSTEVATSASEIAEVMANAGQLGIGKDYLVDFTRTMIDLGNSTDIAADEAATAIAQFANVTRMAQTDFGRFGSALVDLGNNYATTESAVMNMASNLAAAGSQVGLSQAQILGFATALSSVGLEAQAGGTAFSKAMIQMQVAVETGNDSLKDFAKVAGMTTDEFTNLWKADPAGAIEKFIVGLSQMDEAGISAIVTLQDMGFTEVRLRDTLLRATNATELFSSAQETATQAWEENVALTNEASKRYATTESKLKNLKNTAVMAAQQIGDDLNPMVQRLIDGANGLLEKFMALDAGQRQLIIKIAAVAAAAGPVILIFSKITSVVGTVSSALGKFCSSVAAAGGGVKGLFSMISSGPAIWIALAVAAVAATVAIADFVSGAREAREALKAMNETAEEWKNTAAETFYGKSEGLSAFGMSKSDFTRSTENAQDWVDGLVKVWTDGQKETDEIVSTWTQSFQNLTVATRSELENLKTAADEAGYASVSDDLAADIAALDSMDQEVERLLKKRQNGFLTDDEKIRLQELIDAREAIEVKYNLSPADTDGFETIGKKVEAEIARAQARGQSDADVSVYEDAMVAAAEGMAAVNAQLNEQYDREYAVIQLIEDSAERQAALDDLNARYNQQRRDAALDYAETMAGVVLPVWNQEDIQQAKTQVGDLFTTLRKYSMASESDKPAILTELKNLSSEMDEGALTEYLSLVTQIQSLMDEGLTESEVQNMFPDIDVSSALDQFSGIADYLDLIKTDLPGLYSMFDESVPEEVLSIATDLDMTGAQARWDEFASNPGAITTDALINSLSYPEGTTMPQVEVEALVSNYTATLTEEDKANLSPSGLIAGVISYAVDEGYDVHTLDPKGLAATIAAYVDDPVNCDTAALEKEITVQITAYDDSGATLPAQPKMRVVITGYDYLGYKDFEDENPDLELEVPVRLGELEDGELESYAENGKLKVWQDGVEVPIETVPEDMLSADTIATLDADGTLHVIITPELSGSEEAISELREEVAEVDQLGVTAIGKAAGLVPTTTFDMIESAMQRINRYQTGGFWNWLIGATDHGTLDSSMKNDFSSERVAELSAYVAEVVTAIQNGADVSEEDLTNLQSILDFLNGLDETDTGAHIKEGIAQGLTEAGWDADAETVASQLDAALATAFDSHSPAQRMVPMGENVAAGIGEGASGYDFSSDAATIASALEASLQAQISEGSFSEIGNAAMDGLANSMTGYGMESAGRTVGGNAVSAISGSMNASSLRPIGLSAMNGLAAGINAGRSAVISAMREAGRAAVNAAKNELEIHSPSRVFRDEVGRMTMRGFGEGVLAESKNQAGIIRNAARYLTGEARNGAVAWNTNDNRKTYNNSSAVNLTGNTFYVNDERDAYALAVEIAALTRRQQRGKGLRMA